MSKNGQSKSTGRQEASSDSKGFVLSFLPRVQVLKTQMRIPGMNHHPLPLVRATSAMNSCRYKSWCVQRKTRNTTSRNHLSKMSPTPSCHTLAFLLPGRELFTIPPNRVSACQWNGRGSAAPQALQEANKPSLWATQRSMNSRGCTQDQC